MARNIGGAWRVLLAIWLVAGLCGCGATYDSLKCERDCVQYREYCRLRDDQPGKDCTVEVDYGGSGRVPIALHTFGSPSKHAMVMVHGLLSDSKAWRFVAADLSRDHYVIMVDLPGCGASGPPTGDLPRDFDPYTPDALADLVLAALQTHLKGVPEVERVTVVAHSLGAALALRMFASPDVRERRQEMLDRIDRMVLIAPLDLAIEKASPMFVHLSTMTGWEVGFGSATGLLRERVSRGIAASVDESTPALREEADAVMAILQDPDKRTAMQAMLRGAAPSRGDGEYRPDWERIERLTAETSSVDRPILIVWGARDETLPVSMGYKLWAQLPASEMVVIPSAKHSPQLERPQVVVALIREYLGREPHPSRPTGENAGAWGVRAVRSVEEAHAAGE